MQGGDLVHRLGNADGGAGRGLRAGSTCPRFNVFPLPPSHVVGLSMAQEDCAPRLIRKYTAAACTVDPTVVQMRDAAHERGQVRGRHNPPTLADCEHAATLSLGRVQNIWHMMAWCAVLELHRHFVRRDVFPRRRGVALLTLRFRTFMSEVSDE